MMQEIIIVIVVIFLVLAFVVLISNILQKLLLDFRSPAQPDSSSSKSVFPEIRPQLRHQLKKIEPSHNLNLEYFPGMVTLANGQKIDCVYIVDEKQYLKYWGPLPDAEIEKDVISIKDVVKIEESPYRLPAVIANQIYQAGQAENKYHRFTLIFNDLVHQKYYVGSDAIDFIALPAGKTYSDIHKVVFDLQPGENYMGGLPYYWCFYSDENSENAE
jgi:hypothetical protein